MTESLFSPQWYRVADLHPALRSHVKLHRQVIREKVWYLLEDTLSGRQHRLDSIAYGFIGQLDGRFTVHDLWLKLLDQLKDDAPSQYDILRLVGQLHQADLVQCEITPDVEELFARQERRQGQRRRGMVNPLAFRTPLFNPAASLNRIYPLFRWIFTSPFLVFITVIVLMGVMAGAQHFDELRQVARFQLSSPQYWLLMWLVFPFMKVIHEYAHALAVRHWGGNVHEMGITLMLLMPVPYVDASAANLFASKRARILVSAAGIIAEALLASMALLVWLNVEDGLLKDIAFIVVMIGAVSTLLFNGNPLVKFDGYHVFADAVEIPNLAHQSRRHWAWLARHYILRVKASPEAHSLQEQKWLTAYAPASWLYRFFLMLSIGAWLFDVSAILALVVAGLFAWSLFVTPVYKIIRYFLSSPEISHNRAKVSNRVLISVAAILACLLWIPFPYSSSATGVVWAPNDARIRASTDGFVKEVKAPSGREVHQGETLLILENRKLETQLGIERARLSGLQAQYQGQFLSDRTKSAAIREEIRLVQEKIQRLEDDMAGLIVRAPMDGRFHIEHAEDLPGRLLSKGDEFAYVFPADTLQVRVVVDQRDISVVKEKSSRVELRMASAPDTVYEASISENGFTPTTLLPSPALGFMAGGRIVTKPGDEQQLETLHPVFLADLYVADHSPERYGERVWVRFVHPKTPLAQQWAQKLRQLFLKHLAGAS